MTVVAGGPADKAGFKEKDIIKSVDGSPIASFEDIQRLLLLSGVFMAMTFGVFVIYGVTASALQSQVIERPRMLQRVRKLFALSFIGLGVKLATTSR